MEAYDRFRWAEDLFEYGDYRASARVLEQLLDDLESAPAGHPVDGVRELLARAYFHSAQLRKAETTARALLAEDPRNAYAALLLARTLERGSRRDEAGPARALAAALGAPVPSGTDGPTEEIK